MPRAKLRNAVNLWRWLAVALTGLVLLLLVGWEPDRARKPRDAIDDTHLLIDSWMLVRRHLRHNAYVWPSDWEELERVATEQEPFDAEHISRIRDRVAIDFEADLLALEDPPNRSFIQAKHPHPATNNIESDIAHQIWEVSREATKRTPDTDQR